MRNIRQTSEYASFMKKIGWQVEKIDDVFIYIKKLPILAPVLKIQRPGKLPAYEKLKDVMKKYRAASITVEPSPNCLMPDHDYQLTNDPYLQTKTIEIDLTASPEVIFSRFSEAKRRAVRRAQKLGVNVEISNNIEAFIKLKNQTSGPFLGFLTTRGITRPLWDTFAPNYARVLLASLGNSRSKKYVAGIFLLFIDKIAYYWMAAATGEGKKILPQLSWFGKLYNLPNLEDAIYLILKESMMSAFLASVAIGKGLLNLSRALAAKMSTIHNLLKLLN